VGLVRATLDTRFRELATPYLVSWIYRGCLTLIAVVTAWWVLLALWVATWRDGWLWGLLCAVTAPVVGMVLVLLARVACEFTLIRFRAVAPPLPPPLPPPVPAPGPGPGRRPPPAHVDRRPDGRQGDGSRDGRG
jgi:hypothetical protein